LQESHFVFNDDASGNAPMGVELTHTMMQWNYCYNEDITFVILQIKNTSAVDYTNFAVGLYIDIDVGGPDGHGENGRLGDLVARDSSMNLAWIYDADGYDPGWGPLVKTGIMGTRLLETPDNVGMTAFRSGDWGAVTNIDDIGRYQVISSHQYDESLPPTDQYYIQCASGINLTAGKTVKIVYALIAGQDVQDFKEKAALALTLYNNHFVGPQPPATPILSARAADRKVYLHWTDTSEVTPDPLSGQIDFAGYKLYRSDNQGKTWGVVNYKTGNKCMTVDYSPIGLYTRTAPEDPIQHSFVDTGLYNGVDYWYCLAAFDRGDTVTGVDVLQSGFGEPGSSANVAVSRPHNDPAGGFDASSTVTHQYTGTEAPSAGTVTPLEFDKDSLRGADYAVGFKDTPNKTYWYVLNVTTGDTILNNQVLENADPGLYSVRQGLRVVVNNPDRWPASYGQVLNPGADTTIALLYFWGPCLPIPNLFNDSLYGDAKYRSTYEIRWTADSTLAPNVYGSTYQLYSVPVEVWNTSTGQRVSLAVLDATESLIWHPYRSLIIVDQPYNPAEDLFATAYPYGFSWIFKFDTARYAPVLGDRFRFTGAPVNGPDDRFAFKVDGINAATASVDLSKIRVVPNPYLVQYSASVETGQGQSVLEFQKIPDKCTIRIYTLAGDLVKTIEHTDGTGTARWDLKSRNAEQVASGIYLFHVDSPYGQHLGRFAIIK
ncbi:MAG TPA: hypothetical protein VMS71_03735, partial [Candidatus Acidoferrum sp.]|nr:hypothetical protein [Candidatus Acidoferrum sp.]